MNFVVSSIFFPALETRMINKIMKISISHFGATFIDLGEVLNAGMYFFVSDDILSTSAFDTMFSFWGEIGSNILDNELLFLKT